MTVKSSEAWAVAMPRPRFTVRTMMAAVAVVASLIGAERLWQRSQFYRKQAALCAYFESQMLHYAVKYENDDTVVWSIEEKRESGKLNRDESYQYAHLNTIYGRVASHPWELLPPDAPVSINPWDMSELTASEIEEMVKAGSSK